MLLNAENARVTTVTVSELFRENEHGGENYSPHSIQIGIKMNDFDLHVF